VKKVFFSLLTLSISVLIGYHIISIWGGVLIFQIHPTKESFLKAVQIDPSNPYPFYRLGVLHHWDIRISDLKESLHYLQKAIERNPLEQEYWLGLAKVLQRMGEEKTSEQALEKAVLTFPTGYRGRWVAGNLLLQQGAIEKALPHFSYILTHYPNQGHLVYDVWTKVVSDPDFFLERLVPRDSSSLNRYLVYLYESGDKESARKVWAMKAALHYPSDRSETLRHIDFLISLGELGEAFQVWKGRPREDGIPIASDGNLITDGGFEKEKISERGFDWRIDLVNGVQVSFDPSGAFEGRRSLKITFNGKENVDFHHVYQFAALKPDTDYLLRAHFKTKGVTTKSGLKLEFVGMTPAFHKASEALTGDNGWTELAISFRTPPRSQGGMIRVRREKTDKFDRFIAGEVWIDNVRLTENK